MKRHFHKIITVVLTIAIVFTFMPVCTSYSYAADIQVSLGENAVEWTSVSGVSKYNIYILDERQIEPDEPHFVKERNERSLGYEELNAKIDELFEAGSLELGRYYVRVFAVNSYGDIIGGGMVEYPYEPPEPEIIDITGLDISDGVLSWDPVPDAVSYMITTSVTDMDRSEISDTTEPSLEVDSIIRLICEEEPLPCNKEVTFEILAHNKNGLCVGSAGYTANYFIENIVTYIAMYGVTSSISIEEGALWSDRFGLQDEYEHYESESWTNIADPTDYFSSKEEQDHDPVIGATYHHALIIRLDEGYRFGDPENMTVYNDEEDSIESRLTMTRDENNMVLKIEGILPDVTIQCDGHVFGQWEVTEEATCTEPGTEERTCSKCGYVESRETEALGHDFSNESTIDKEPTCAEEGSESRHCLRCDAKTDVTPIPMIDHVYGDWHVTEEATCTETGTEERSCTVCGNTETRETAALGHDYEEYVVVTPATCTEHGLEKVKCSRCGAVSDNAIHSLGHHFSEEYTVDKEATCTEEGSKSRHCTRCEATTDVTVIPKLDHNFGEWEVTKEAGCEEAGTQTRTCSLCGQTETQEIAALGHNWGAWKTETEATEMDDGLKQRVCGRCGETETEVIPATGNEYGVTYDKVTGKLTWNAVEGADSYSIWLYRGDHETSLDGRSVTETQYDVTKEIAWSISLGDSDYADFPEGTIYSFTLEAIMSDGTTLTLWESPGFEYIDPNILAFDSFGYDEENGTINWIGSYFSEVTNIMVYANDTLIGEYDRGHWGTSWETPSIHICDLIDAKIYDGTLEKSAYGNYDIKILAVDYNKKVYQRDFVEVPYVSAAEPVEKETLAVTYSDETKELSWVNYDYPAPAGCTVVTRCYLEGDSTVVFENHYSILNLLRSFDKYGAVEDGDVMNAKVEIQVSFDSNDINDPNAVYTVASGSVPIVYHPSYSEFEVKLNDNSNGLTWDPVEDGSFDHYEWSISGYETSYTFSIGQNTSLSFEDIQSKLDDMLENGNISDMQNFDITVYACDSSGWWLSKGLYPSYYYEKELPAINNVLIDSEGNMTWDEVEGASWYVIIFCGDREASWSVEGTSADLCDILDTLYRNGQLNGHESPYSVSLRAVNSSWTPIAGWKGGNFAYEPQPEELYGFQFYPKMGDIFWHYLEEYGPVRYEARISKADEPLPEEPVLVIEKDGADEFNIPFHINDTINGMIARGELEESETYHVRLSAVNEKGIVFQQWDNKSYKTDYREEIGEVTNVTNTNYFPENRKDIETLIYLYPAGESNIDFSTGVGVYRKEDPNYKLKEGTDYNISYEKNEGSDTVTLTITGTGDYKGTAVKQVKVAPATVMIEDEPLITSGTPDLDATVKVTVNGTEITLVKEKDYVINPVIGGWKPGEREATVHGWGDYAGSVEATYRMVGDLEKTTVTIADQTYTGKALTPEAAVTYNGTTASWGTLTEGKDYNIAYSDNINAGDEATAVITPCEGSFYVGSKTVNFTIKKASQTITAKVGTATTTTLAVGKTATITVTGAKGTKSFSSADTKIATVDSKGKITAKKVGTVKITVKAASTTNYNAASKTITVKVTPAATTSLTAANQTTGIKLTWKKVTGATGYKVYRGSTLLKKITSGSTVTYTDTKANTNGTKYTFKVVPYASTGDGTSKSLTTYRVSKPAITSATNSAAGKATVKWGKNTKATGYEIWYSTSKSFSTKKTKAITKNTTVSTTLGSLTKGKTYYVKIRTYKTVSGKKYYSAWSAVKTVKITK